jgi:Na+/proline symporter
LFFIIKNHGHLSADVITHEYSVMPIDYIILFSIPALFTPLSQDINLRIKSAKNRRNGKLGLIMGGVFYFSITLTTAYIGIYLGNNNVDLADPEQAIPLFFKNNFSGIGIIAIIASLAAIISTLDSYTLNSITSISNDIIKPLSKSENNVPKTIKVASLITYVIAMAIALFFNKVLLLSLTSLLVYISVLIPIVLGNALKLQSSKIFIGSIINILAIVIIEIVQLPISPKAVFYPVIGCSIIMVFRLFNTKKKEK